MSTNSTPPGLLTIDQKRAHLDALLAAYSRGVEYVSYDGDQIKYVPGDEIRRRINSLCASLGIPSPIKPLKIKSRRIVTRVR